jgi:hypothetical protein
MARGRSRPDHPEGTLGIELSAFTLSLYPLLVLPLGQAQLLSGSTSRSATRQARKLVLGANYDDAVRVVTEPGGGVSLAYEANDDRIYCMDAMPGSDLTRLTFDEGRAVEILQGTLEVCLLDEIGRIKEAADVKGAFTLAVIALKGWLALGKPLGAHEIEIAANTHHLKISPWGCEKPDLVRAALT